MTDRRRLTARAWQHARRAVAEQSGVTLIEIIAASAILTIAVVALLSSITAGFTSIDQGRLQSAAVFLAEQRLEEIRAFAVSTITGQGFANVTTGNFPAEAYGTIASNPLYRRVVAVSDNPGGVANTKRVDVSVFYRPQTTIGLNGETSVNVSTLITLR
jgi:prepilin-type N-terminal cleavage/methylation domain-containing protein